MTAREIMPVQPTARHACVNCPWRISNQAKRHPDGWYTVTNLRRLWRGLRRGEGMSCHPTDPNNPVSEKAQAAGYRPAPAGSKVMECVGALVVVQREFMIFQERHGMDLRQYRALRPKGLMRGGLMMLVERAIFGGSPGTRSLVAPDLGDPDIGHPDLPDWKW